MSGNVVNILNRQMNLDQYLPSSLTHILSNLYISCTLIGKKLFNTQITHSRLNTCLQWIEQRQVQVQTRNISVFWELGCLIFEIWWQAAPGPQFNTCIKMTSYQYRKSHCGDKTILRPSYLHNGISYTGKTTSLHWTRAQASMRWHCFFFFFQFACH